MTPENIFSNIPEEYHGLFTGSAREVLGKAGDMITGKPFKEQKRILSDPIFCMAVNSALYNLDQRRRGETINFISKFPKKLQPQASNTFLNESN